ncbi:hypothetical protein K493DRAFT_52432 [Basidiobolus meristosporus CBS 931.73]|uniref:TLC domain-containing protein n=1 Tax=Basidiobolus meristosporus CBS 931.73 TaxID=1314790 RepID=A0A1Y1Y0V7_9FUNG|nr:hypothetical protein K493DRAFT_52432 [Basidiobolus meristosporus CBS 931.73]|eukprot:ORX91264.1 hypothetical protein K493DRAFT_52432 [Basidiobolus meristosporus CBS 931.73]
MSSTTSGPTLEQSIQTIFRECGFEKLAFHWQLVLMSAGACQGTFCLSSALSPLLFRKAYGNLSDMEQISWDAKAVSFLHCILTAVLAFSVRFEPHLREDRVHGYSPHAENVYAIACGYFLWNTMFYSKYIKEYGLRLLISVFSRFVLTLSSYVGNSPQFILTRKVDLITLSH